MNSRLLTEHIKAEAQRLGFFACGIAKATKVDDDYACHYREQIRLKRFSNMHYMYENVEKRLDPQLLVPGVKSIVSVALNYAPRQYLPKDEFQIAAYALGQDYHDIVKKKLFQLAATIEEENIHYRCFVDTAPVLERYWAQKAGIGWIGKSQQLIIPHAGSLFFLGEIFLDVELEYDAPATNHCGNCRKCIESCPTQAIAEDEGNSAFYHVECSKCLSYQTIENRGTISEEAKSAMGNTIYGCDKCLQACPWNRFSCPTTIEELQPKPQLLAMKKADWLQLSVEQYRLLFKGSAVKRAKYDGLMRNITAVNSNLKAKDDDKA
ncbi:MAG: tRNA epoxyqueuosine(34) reductase QueG [Prevotella sp.]|jgi:epoxyqueuosine reductase|nr:tRNA epoxyqueuosine(34) reductase QueG [Prevotella sp.]MCI1282549.1 tRNA epoxyqueuosine(34) reductase QueG [Prevotella sp.]